MNKPSTRQRFDRLSHAHGYSTATFGKACNKSSNIYLSDAAGCARYIGLVLKGKG